MSKQKISAKDLIADIRAGMDDPSLMKKYGLSAQGLQTAFRKLVEANVLKQAELDKRLPLEQRTADLAWECPACGMPQVHAFDQCPKCGTVVSKIKEVAPKHDILEPSKELVERQAQLPEPRNSLPAPSRKGTLGHFLAKFWRIISAQNLRRRLAERRRVKEQQRLEAEEKRRRVKEQQRLEAEKRRSEALAEEHDRRQNELALENQYSQFLEQCQKGGIPVIHAPSIVLKKSEEVYFASAVKVQQQKTRKKTHRGYAGTRVKIGKVPFYFGGSSPYTTSEEVIETVGLGDFFITNKRIILVGTKINYSINISKINGAQLFTDAVQIYNEGTNGGRFYHINDPRRAAIILEVLLSTD